MNLSENNLKDAAWQVAQMKDMVEDQSIIIEGLRRAGQSTAMLAQALAISTRALSLLEEHEHRLRDDQRAA